MGRDGFGRVVWNQFDGGIEQVPERAQPGQVLDARNVWAPYGPVERRPGTRLIRNLGDLTSISMGSESSSTVNNGDGTWTHTVVYPDQTRDPSLPDPAILCGLTAPQVDLGGGIFSGSMELISGPPITDLVYTARTFRLTVNSAPQGAGHRNGLFIYVGPTTPLLLAEIPWGAKLGVLIIYEQYQVASRFAPLGWYVTFIMAAQGGIFSADTVGAAVTPGEQASLVNTIPAPSACRIATVAPVPFSDVTFLTYNYTMYALTPTGGFALAQVNTDPDFVGPRQDGGVTPPFSVDVMALLAEPPRAAIVVHFLGMLFALDIIGDQYSVRWSAPVIETGPNLVWPGQNFEPLDEDGGKPRAAKPLNEYLVVYQASNIYTFVPDVPDPITGLAQFDPKRLVSGVGTESHNAVVEVQGRHLFPARDGFYAFDGSPIPQKISQPIDQFYRTLGRAALAQSRGVHWPEFHCVLWAVRQRAVSDDQGVEQQLHYIILYDYIKNAWWIWDKVVGGGGLARMFYTDTQAGIYILSSISMVYRMTGNSTAALAGVPGGSVVLTSTPVDITGAYILTHRLGEAAFTTDMNREIWVEATTNADEIQIEIIADDDADPDPKTMSMRSDDPAEDIRWGATKWGASKWYPNKRRARLLGAAAVGRHVQLKITLINALNRAWKLVRAGLAAVKRRSP
jgi:hypothetical protein